MDPEENFPETVKNAFFDSLDYGLFKATAKEVVREEASRQKLPTQKGDVVVSRFDAKYCLKIQVANKGFSAILSAPIIYERQNLEGEFTKI